MSSRWLSMALMSVLTLGVMALARAPAWAKEAVWESEQDNVLLRILDDGTSSWEWLQSRPEWKKEGVVKAARRVLTRLKNDKPAAGQGGLLHLVIRDVKEDETLADLAASSDVKSWLLARFGGTAKEVETEEGTVLSGTSEQEGHPCVILRAEGEANNLSGNKGRCVGVLVVTKWKDKLYLLRMFAFPTEFDPEGLTVDLDYMEGNALTLLNTKAEDDKEGAKPPPPPPEEGGEGPPPEERTEPEVIEHVEQKWRISIHPKLHRQEISEEEDADNLVLKIEDNDQHGGVMLYMYAPQTTQYIDGVKAAPPNLTKWMTEDWWTSFTTTHPEGDLYTWKWPKKQEGKNPTFLVIPDLADEKNREDLITGSQKRPIEVSQSDARKMGFAEKPKKNNLGRQGKGGEAMRGCLEGNRPRIGKETVFRYAWRSPSHSYRLFVIFSRDGYKKYGQAMRETLESLEFVKKFK